MLGRAVTPARASAAAAAARPVLRHRHGRTALGWSGASSSSVNGVYTPNNVSLPSLTHKDNQTGEVSAAHWDEDWSNDTIDAANQEHVVFTW